MGSNIDNNIIAVHESESFERLWHQFGKIDDDQNIIWKEDRYYSAGKQPSIALYHDGTSLGVVEVHRESDSPHRLRYIIGYVNTRSGKIDWDGYFLIPDNVYSESGETPSIRINQRGDVLLCYRESSASNTLLYRKGNMLTERRINWTNEEDISYDAGFMPAATIDNHGNIIAVHELDQNLCFARP